MSLRFIASKSLNNFNRTLLVRKNNLNLINFRRNFISSIVLKNQISTKVNDILKSEHNLEIENIKSQDFSNETFNNFLQKYDFSLIDNSNGKNMSEIKKTTNDETIHVFFDVAQVANLPFDPMANNANNDQAQSNEMITEEDFDSLSDNFANVNVVITNNSNKKTVSFELLMNLAEGSFYIDSVTPYENEQKALDESAEAEVSRELVYHGPPFSNLDEELQESLELYLESRGITSELSSFITSYSEFKENHEYVNWLDNLKQFFGN
ncbi:hypothetical protein Kpol_387p13 [Vanderwaltozyma polyspora DSM 70294]|uniref:Mitochondrial acidic protein MAM33 n=1 Tax=Vanderwaltozyma polyspora (strain ATCC 22028 / DSM 70294 / BCRC 21397 / CBS 2163 / NBRC 10782 / NRRL Y-8283 / UCD 57-17) TaxID=436907 RepID=A7TRY2_VANPO|nr:uncharacterized protein Kpol_387p13 [Vanderwaltozyma polyspora DSM 70294]EDO14987.1 hypothetical protein Kpol_387p13 [Vanderwaltozyma polyspora DSM 70294]